MNVPTPTRDITSLLPIHTTLTSGEHVLVMRVASDDESQLSQLHDMLNHEIREGKRKKKERKKKRKEEKRKHKKRKEEFISILTVV